MTPYLVDNDLVTLEPVDAANIRVGDLVYTQQPGLPPLLHRVIERVRREDGDWSVLTKGDSLAMRDPAVRAGSVAGRAVTIRRDLASGIVREQRLGTRRQRCLQHFLALGSRHAPRSFAAISRRLVPGWERLAARVRPGS
jgi:hypothetical protein